MSNRNPESSYTTPAGAIPFAIEQWCRDHLWTSLPGIIRAYDARTFRARVQPAIRAVVAARDGSTKPQDRAAILDVPVLWPGGGGYTLHTPLGDGDQVWLVFSARGIEEYKRTLELATPPELTCFQARDAACIPYRAAPIEAVGKSEDGTITDVSPTKSGPLTSVDSLILQETQKGDPYIRIEKTAVTVMVGQKPDDDTATIRLDKSSITMTVGQTTLDITSAGMKLVTPAGTQTWNR